MEEHIQIQRAFEPSDILWENLEYFWTQKIKKRSISYLISLVLFIASYLCLFFISELQSLVNKSETNQIYKKLLGIISYITVTIINYLITYIVRKLVIYEKHSSYTDQNLSFATKLSLIYFINSAFIPFLILLISDR